MCTDTHWIIKNEDKFVILVLDYDEGATGLTNTINNKRVTSYVKCMDNLKLNVRHEFRIIYEQCIKSLRSRIEAMKGWVEMKAENDLISLIKVIKGLSHKFYGRNYHANYLCNLHCNFYTFKQRGLSNTAYLDKFKLKVDIIEQYGGN